MTKKKISLGYRIEHLFTYHPLLKIIALFLSILLWFYVTSGKFK